MAAPVVLRIKLRYDDVETLVQKFAVNAGKSGLFLPTKSIQPLGTEIKFELRLANDTPVLVGLGSVRATRDPDPANPKALCGMSVELLRVTKDGREVIMKMLERRRALGLPEVGVPTPADVDAARRVDGQTGVTTMTPAMGVPVTGPVVTTAAASPEQTTATPTGTNTELRDAQYNARSMPAEAAPSPGDALLTSPRPAQAIGRAKRESAIVILPLAAEPSRRLRPAVAEVIARAVEASGAVAAAISVPGLDEDVDIGRAMARARVLAASGGDLDAELDALRDAAAAPLAEITVEAASAELARQLGGAPVRRDRSQGWAPPPAVAAPTATATPTSTSTSTSTATATATSTATASASASEPIVAESPAPEPVAVAVAVQVEEQPLADEEIPAEAHIESELRASAEHIEVPPGVMIHDDADPAHVFRTVTAVSDEHFDADDLEDRGESTQIGEMPIAPESYETQPAFHDHDLEQAEQVEPEHHALRADDDGSDYSEPAIAYVPSPGDVEVSAIDESVPVEAIESEELAAPEEPIEALADDEIQEIDDFEILAEADADADAVPLAAEADPAHHLEPNDDFEPAPRPSAELDADVDAVLAAARLDVELDEPEADEPAAFEGTRVAARPLAAHDIPAARTTAGSRRATPGVPDHYANSDFDFSAFDELDADEQAQVRARSENAELAELDASLRREHSAGYQIASYQVPESAEDIGFDRPASEPSYPSDLAAFEAASYHGKPLEVERASAIELDAPRAGQPYDLDSALDDLGGFEVELEGGSIHHHPPQPQAKAKPAARAGRARFESEGVNIDFDEEEDSGEIVKPAPAKWRDPEPPEPPAPPAKPGKKR